MMMLRDMGGLRGLGAFGDSCPPGTSDDGTGNCTGAISCPAGYAWSSTNNACVCIDSSCMGGGSSPSCPAGFAWSSANGGCTCIDSSCMSAGAGNCPSGTVWVNFYNSCVATCPAGQVYSSAGVCTSAAAGANGGAPVTPANSAGGSTNQTVVGLLAAFGAKLVGAPTVPGAITVAAPTPWYSTPIGLLLIVGGIAGVYFMTKGPSSSTVVVK